MSRDLHVRSDVKGAPAWTMPGKYASTVARPSSANSPGPGAYSFQTGVGSSEVGSKFKKAPGFSWPHKARGGPTSMSTGAAGIGPGAYDTMREVSRPGSSKGFGSQAPRNVGGGFSNKNLGGGPGPGAYETPGLGSIKRGAPAFSMAGGRMNRANNEGTPGPGAYSPPSDYNGRSRNGVASNRSVASQFSKARRDPGGTNGATNKMTPGPGAYNADFSPTSNKARAPQFSIRSGRNEGRKSVGAPGPGAYASDYSLFPKRG